MGKVRNKGALAAWIGRKKYGKNRYARMAAAGRRRAARGGKKTSRPGGGKRFANLKRKLSRKR